MDDVGHLQYVVLSLLYWYTSNVLNRYTLVCIHLHFLSSVIGCALHSWLRDKGSLKKDLQVVTEVITETAVLLNVTCRSVKDEYEHFEGIWNLLLGLEMEAAALS